MDGRSRPDSRQNTRRETLRRGALATGALLIGPALVGCATAQGHRARPAPATPTTHLVVSLSYHGAGVYGGVVRDLVDAYIAQNFASQHAGVAVTTVVPPVAAAPSATTAPQDAASIVAPVVAGKGPDVLSGTGYQLAAFMDAALLIPLDALVRQAGLDLSAFDPGHLEVLRQLPQAPATAAPGGATPPNSTLFGLPAYDGPAVVLVNRSTLDAAGLALPDANWTSEQAVGIWSRLAGQRAGRHHYGMAFDLQDYFLHLFGGDLMSPDGSRCLLDQPLVLQAANWLVPLYQNGIADVMSTGAGGDVRSGVATFGMTEGSSLQAAVLAMEGMKVGWDFLPMPVFPGGRRSTYNNGDWYGINARSQHPQELLWALFRFIASDAGLARLLFRTTFVPPNQRALREDWLTSVRAAAPVLQGKHLEYFVQAMDYGYCNHRFRRQPYACDLILQQWIIRIFLGTVSPTLGLQQATTQINALQAQR